MNIETSMNEFELWQAADIYVSRNFNNCQMKLLSKIARNDFNIELFERIEEPWLAKCEYLECEEGEYYPDRVFFKIDGKTGTVFE